MNEIQENQAKNKPERNPAGQLLPGNTANLKGRPRKGQAWADIDNDILSANALNMQITYRDKSGGMKTKTIQYEVKDEHGNKMALRAALMATEAQLALSGDMEAIKDLRDRDMGKPHQSIGMSVEPPEPDGYSDEEKAVMADALDKMDNDKNKPLAGTSPV